MITLLLTCPLLLVHGYWRHTRSASNPDRLISTCKASVVPRLPGSISTVFPEITQSISLWKLSVIQQSRLRCTWTVFMAVFHCVKYKDLLGWWKHNDHPQASFEWPADCFLLTHEFESKWDFSCFRYIDTASHYSKQFYWLLPHIWKQRGSINRNRLLSTAQDCHLQAYD